MKLYFICSECQKEYCIAAVDPNKHLLIYAKVPCPDGCIGTLKQIKKKDTSKVKEPSYFSAKELFQLAMGRGSALEQECSAGKLIQVLVGERIKSLDMEDLEGKDRVILNSMTMENGKVIHFATSTHGATIYKVTKELR